MGIQICRKLLENEIAVCSQSFLSHYFRKLSNAYLIINESFSFAIDRLEFGNCRHSTQTNYITG